VPDPNIAKLHPGDNGKNEKKFSLEEFDPTRYELLPF